MQEIVPGVACLPLSIENVYFIGAPGQPWTLVDTGTPGAAGRIRAAAAKRYGENARPQAILLTHGHTDHAGSAAALAEAWNVPIYAHPLEFPYLTGQSKYPPKDPTVGGAMALVSRVFPMNVTNLTGLLQPLPEDGVVPGLPDWQWLFTPGHSPGHVSYFNAEKSLLLAGDAFTTVNTNSFAALATKNPEISLPPPPFTLRLGRRRAVCGPAGGFGPTGGRLRPRHAAERPDASRRPAPLFRRVHPPRARALCCFSGADRYGRHCFLAAARPRLVPGAGRRRRRRRVWGLGLV